MNPVTNLCPDIPITTRDCLHLIRQLADQVLTHGTHAYFGVNDRTRMLATRVNAALASPAGDEDEQMAAMKEAILVLANDLNSYDRAYIAVRLRITAQFLDPAAIERALDAYELDCEF